MGKAVVNGGGFTRKKYGGDESKHFKDKMQWWIEDLDEGSDGLGTSP